MASRTDEYRRGGSRHYWWVAAVALIGAVYIATWFGWYFGLDLRPSLAFRERHSSMSISLSDGTIRHLPYHELQVGCVVVECLEPEPRRATSDPAGASPVR